MMATINPLGERGRGNVFWRTGASFVAGCVVGGWVLGALGGASGFLLSPAVPGSTTAFVLLAAAFVLIAGLAELAAWGVPTVHRQVDERWVGRYRGWVYGAGFGVQLGSGLTTTVTTAAVYATVGLAFILGAAGQPEWAQLTGIVFGVARAAPVMGAWTLRDPESVRRRAARAANVTGTVRVTTGFCLTVLALSAAVGL